jgi:drug/metabolite transporter (DMT)-like permease
MNDGTTEQMAKPENRRFSLIYPILLIFLFVGIGIYSQDLRESISALCMILLVIGHFRTKRKTKEGEKSGTPESSVFISMTLGVLLLVAIFYAWNYAIQKGGLWWILFLVVGFTCLRVGESLKRGLEAAVRDSKHEQKSKDIQSR